MTLAVLLSDRYYNIYIMFISVFLLRVHKRTIVLCNINKYSSLLGIGGLMRATDTHVIRSP